MLKDLQRSDLKPTEVWADALANLSNEARTLTSPASGALEVFLLISQTNAAVEQDAGTARLIRECTSNKAEADLLDTRIRLKTEGPAISKATTSTKAGGREYHPFIREAAKDFLVDSRKLHGTSAGKKLGPITDEHKAKLSAASTRKRTGTALSFALGVRLESFEPPVVEPDAGKGEEEDIEKLLEEEEVEFLSTQPPDKKKARTAGASKGRGRGHGPSSAEVFALGELAEGAEGDVELSE